MLDELFTAIRARDLATVERLADADRTLLGRRNEQGMSALSLAAYMQQPQMVAALRQRRGTPDY